MDKDKRYKSYDERTSRNMAKYNRQGGSVARPVRDVSNASPDRKLTRGRFLLRKATQILSQSQPLKDDKGRQTPAAMQFKRWDAPIPSNYDQVRRLKEIGKNIVERYSKKNK